MTPEAMQAETTPAEQAAAYVAAVIGRSPRQVRWSNCPGGYGLVVRTPWARVVVARTIGAAVRWADAWRIGGRGGTWLVESLYATYPREITPWASASELGEEPLTGRLRGFLTWALAGKQSVWALTPGLAVIGSWASWPDAVLVASREEQSVFQLRVTEWTDAT